MNQPEGTLMQRAIQLSFDDIESTLPMQLASRQMAAYNNVTNQTCTSYLSQVYDEMETNTTCTTFNFANLTDL